MLGVLLGFPIMSIVKPHPALRPLPQGVVRANRPSDLDRTKQSFQPTRSSQINPTKEAFGTLIWAYDFFNQHLFEGRLPLCLMTMQRQGNNTAGYFAGHSWKNARRDQVTDEIALNPDCFPAQSTAEVLQTLVHEMVHLEQHHFGRPSRSGYHNKEWAQWMRRVGLIPSSNGLPGGKETGQAMSEYIDPGGPFYQVCLEILATGFVIPWHTIQPTTGHEEGAGSESEANDDDAHAIKTKKRASKTKYSCASCGLNAWAKPQVRLLCVTCQSELCAAS